MTDLLEGRELDEAVAKMMGWIEEEWPSGYAWVKDDTGYTESFCTPYALHGYVLPWAREQGFFYRTDWDGKNHEANFWNRNTRWVAEPDTPSGGYSRRASGRAFHPDEIVARLNALVRAWEAQG